MGNNQIDEAWLDESLATYSETLYIIHKYGDKEGGKLFLITPAKCPYDLYGKSYIESDVVVKPLSKFHSWEDYGLLVYVKGAIFLNEIKKDFGMATLIQILNRYYDTYRFKIARTEDFLRICEEVTNSSFKEKAQPMALWQIEKGGLCLPI